MVHRIFMTRSGKRNPENKVVGCSGCETTNLVKCLSMRHKLQNSNGHAESPEFLSALGLEEVLSLQLEVN